MLRVVAVLWSFAALVGCDARPSRAARAFGGGDEPTSGASAEPIEPLPAFLPHNPARAAIGARLFDDRALSGDGKVACVDCHRHDAALADTSRTTNLGSRPPGPVNVPTLLNVATYASLNWTGKFSTLEAHIDGLVQNPAVMASSWERAALNLRAAGRASLFEGRYADGLTAANVRDAILEYERSLTTPNARFDRYLRGDAAAIDARELAGYRAFKSLGCISCHHGVAVGTTLFERFGVMEDRSSRPDGGVPGDQGRFGVTHDESDRYVFRVPSLRNVAATAPYFHDGSAATLEEAVREMGRVQLGRELSDEQVSEIAAFLRTLTGELDGKPVGS